MSNEESITFYIKGLKQNDSVAAELIWRRYLDQLVRLAKAKLGPRRMRSEDEEDVALSVYRRLLDGVKNRQFVQLDDRDDLWQILIMLTERKAIAVQRYELAAKRDARRQVSQRAEAGHSEMISEVARAACPEPTPELAAAFNEEVMLRLGQLKDDVLRKIAVLKLEGYSNIEIAEHTNLRLRSVERKLAAIRRQFDTAVNELNSTTSEED